MKMHAIEKRSETSVGNIPAAQFENRIDRSEFVKQCFALLSVGCLTGCRDQKVAGEQIAIAQELSTLLEGSGLALQEVQNAYQNYAIPIYYIETDETCARIVKQPNGRFFVFWKRGLPTDPGLSFQPFNNQDSDHFDTAEDAALFIKQKFSSDDLIPNGEASSRGRVD